MSHLTLSDPVPLPTLSFSNPNHVPGYQAEAGQGSVVKRPTTDPKTVTIQRSEKKK